MSAIRRRRFLSGHHSDRNSLGPRDAYSRKPDVYFGLGKQLEQRQNRNLRYYEYRDASPDLTRIYQDPTSITAGNSMHSAWSSEDGNYLYSCRETKNGSGDVRDYDIHDPANPVLVNSFGMNALGLNAVTPHNPVVMGNYLYVAWYQAGLQVFDITTPRSRNASANTIPTNRHLRRLPEEKQAAIRRNRGIWFAERTTCKTLFRPPMTVTGRFILSSVKTGY